MRKRLRRWCFALLSLSACKDPPADLNRSFEDPNMDVAHFEKLFEAEDRAVFVNRVALVEALGVKPGSSVADVGAGTGFFLEHFAAKVGPEGTVYAVEISDRFLEHITKMAKAKGLKNVRAIRGTDRSVSLPPGSVDLVLICDTYHHFDAPVEVMRSIHAALRPGGRVAVIDFIRIEGVTKDPWVLEHVRAGEEVFEKEIVSAGFRRIPTPAGVGFLKQTYLAMFEKTAVQPTPDRSP